MKNLNFRLIPNGYTSWITLVLLSLFFASVLLFLLSARKVSGVEVKTPYNSISPQIVRLKAVVTAYSSDVWQTDDTPFITANMQTVREGIAANNCLPFGTKVIIGDRVYEIHDRMSKRYGCERFDVWQVTETAAREWGLKHLTVIVLP